MYKFLFVFLPVPIVVELTMVVAFEVIALEVVVLTVVVAFNVVVVEVVDDDVLVLLDGDCDGDVTFVVVCVKTVELIVDLDVGAMVDVVVSDDTSGLQSLSNLVDSLQPPGNDSSHILIDRLDGFL